MTQGIDEHWVGIVKSLQQIEGISTIAIDIQSERNKQQGKVTDKKAININPMVISVCT